MNYINEMKIQFLNKSVNEGLARVAVASFCAQLDLTVEVIADIKTAVSEAVTNAIVHGYENMCGFVTVCCAYSMTEIEITVSDYGRGIEDIEQVNKEYIPSEIDFETYFDDVIGASVAPRDKIDIQLKFSEHRFPYVLTKAIHKSQRVVDIDNRIVQISVIPNNELEALILSFGKDVEVLSPVEYRERIQGIIRESFERYYPVQIDCTTND